jgi:hypothetical protein
LAEAGNEVVPHFMQHHLFVFVHDSSRRPEVGRVLALPILGVLHHRYVRILNIRQGHGLVRVVAVAFRPRALQIAENVCLRQQFRRLWGNLLKSTPGDTFSGPKTVLLLNKVSLDI